MADFMGRPEAEPLAAQAVPIIKAMAMAYTRGTGFEAGEPNDEIAAVIVTASARMVANPGQIETYSQAGQFTSRSGAGFKGWELAETFVLNRYRKRAL
ncbi:hypothetical protein [Nocardia sp. NPDC127526]|uniref:hypothetical protein n=1 Tax=Nocardia sp. NPDC127526 TaxID=3345393 RepID=UPI003630F6F9